MARREPGYLWELSQQNPVGKLQAGRESAGAAEVTSRRGIERRVFRLKDSATTGRSGSRENGQTWNWPPRNGYTVI